MAIARDLVQLESGLRERADIDLFSPIERSGLLSDAECSSIVARLTGKAPKEPASIMRLCLQALRIQHEEMRPKLLDAEFVATLPLETPGIARPTETVMREMIARASREVILLGYEFTDLELVEALANCTSTGADVIMICDRAKGSARRIIEAWPPSVRAPKIFHDRERADGAPYASMHAKCLLVDGNDLLVTSANFTFHGLHGNIEIGVRLSGPPAAEARKIFSHLVENGVVEECE